MNVPIQSEISSRNFKVQKIKLNQETKTYFQITSISKKASSNCLSYHLQDGENIYMNTSNIYTNFNIMCEKVLELWPKSVKELPNQSINTLNISTVLIPFLVERINNALALQQPIIGAKKCTKFTDAQIRIIPAGTTLPAYHFHRILRLCLSVALFF